MTAQFNHLFVCVVYYIHSTKTAKNWQEKSKENLVDIILFCVAINAIHDLDVYLM